MHLPYLPSDRLVRLGSASPDEALALIAKDNNAWRVTHINARARMLGLREGLSLTDTRALYPQTATPTLTILESDMQADARVLDQLADWALRYTPLAATHGADSLILDISGCAHLFAGEEALRADMIARLRHLGFAARISIADTIGAAWALSHYGLGAILPAGQERAALAPLPLAALRLPADLLAALERLGLKRIGDVAQGPRAPLTARFGTMLLQQLARALGHEDEPFSPRLPLAPYWTSRNFADPIAREEDVRLCALHLLQYLRDRLERHGEGALRLRLSLFRADGAVKHVEAGLSRATRDARIMQDILCQRLDALADEIDPGFGFDCIAVAILEAAPMVEEALALSTAYDPQSIIRFIDRLGARIGRARIMRLMPAESHVPEYAVHVIPATESIGKIDWPKTQPEPDSPPHRPIRLFAKPEPVETMASVPDGPPVRFRWRRMMHHIALAEGPERLASEWWRDLNGKPLTRDYFRVEDREGRRFWLYRDGLYDETQQPRWFIHGLFA